MLDILRTPLLEGADRAALDTSVLLSNQRPYLVAAAMLGYYDACISNWVFVELARKRTEWIAERAHRDGVDLTELQRRFRNSRHRVNTLVHELSVACTVVNYTETQPVDLAWLADPDDWPVMWTALSAHVDVLVTDHSTDFPLGERRHGVLLLGSEAFLQRLYTRFPGAEAAIREYMTR